MSSPTRPRIASFVQLRPGHQVYLENVQGGMSSSTCLVRFYSKLLVTSGVERDKDSEKKTEFNEIMLVLTNVSCICGTD